MEEIKFAIIGCGSISNKHGHCIKNYLTKARISAACDLDTRRAAEFTRKFGGKPFPDISAMVSGLSEEVDIFSVLTPSGAHAKNISEIAPLGKPIIVEKPLALKLDEADQILNICDKYGVKLFVVHQNRYNIPILKLKEALDQGRFGKLVLGTVRLRWKRDQAYYDAEPWRGTWAYDGGVFTNQAGHHLDMLTWLMGPVEYVKAYAATQLVHIECEDTGVAILKFNNGALGIIEVTTAARPKDLEGSISILGEKGSVVIGGFFMNELVTWQFADERAEDHDLFEKYSHNPGSFAYNHGEYLKGVLTSLQNNQAGLVDGLEGRKSLELINAIYESVETGNDIRLRFKPQKCKLGIVS
jgi:UDP-N-acetyl-2-amino-2-deoxyglucuronate dehydrogenase